jgi:IPT/TIG domain
MKSAAKLLVMSLLACACALAQTSVPRIIATDLQSGPNTGGPNNKGAIVTLYGFGFGATQGASNISVGGISADNYLSWSNTKISFQIGTAAASGNVLVNTSAGVSNPKPFTVRSGR